MVAWIEDRWLTVDATSTERRSLNGVSDPLKARVSPEHRKAGFGSGRRWMVYWEETLPNGGRKRRNRRFESRSDAEAWRTEVDDDIRSGRYIDKASGLHTFGEAAAKWMDTKYDIRRSTRDCYEFYLNRAMLPRWCDTPMKDFDPIVINAWIKTLVSPKDDGGMEYSRATMRIIRFVFTSIIDMAIDLKWTADNPAKRARWPKPPKPGKRAYLTVEQVAALADASDRLALEKTRSTMGGDGTIILFLAYTGLRIGEAIALDVGDIDLTRMVVHVTKTLSAHRIGPTKNGVRRDVTIPRFLRDRLAFITMGQENDAPLFRNKKGQRMSYSSWHCWRWKPAVEAAGLGSIQYLTPHSLRHTYASMLIGSGMDVKTVQKLLGHSSAAMTLDVYADLWPGNEQKAADALDAMYAAAR